MDTGSQLACGELNQAELSTAVQQQIAALKDHTDWAHRAGNVLLIGPSGAVNPILPPLLPVN